MKEGTNVGIIVQARMGSTRLPGKVMKEIFGKTLLEHLILRLKKVKNAGEIIIATTRRPEDDIVIKLAKELGVSFFRGSEDNVLERYYEAAREFGLDVIVRITSDCPVMDPKVVDRCIKFYFDSQPIDYISNCIKRTFPIGLDVEVFSFSALERAYCEATQDYEKEHVAPYIYQHPLKFRIGSFENNMDFSFHRWTVDTKEDFELISMIYNRLYLQNPEFGFDEILILFEKEPALININEHVRQKKLEEK